MNVPLSLLEMPLVSAYVHEVSGIVLDSTKDYLVQSRLGPLLEREGISSYSELIRLAREDLTGHLRGSIVDAVATNETSFFRDQRPFDLMAFKVIPDILQRQVASGRVGKPRLDIWCAACSTGQEVYSLTMLLKEMLFDLDRYWIRILGTDISEWALTVASRGIYSAGEAARGLSERRMQRFFVPVEGGYKISDELRALATYAPLNLLDRFRHVGTFDVVFCRNVSIYFSIPNRAKLFDALADQLRTDGILIIGGSESLVCVTQRFAREDFRGAIYYRKIR